MLREKVKQIEELQTQIKECKRCNLSNKREYFGTGPLTATIMVIGQAPSIYRRTNEHFSQKSKPYFAKFLEIMNLKKDQIWITNVAKCIEYGITAGDPSQCKQFLKKEIEIVNPSEIFIFGKVACTAILGSAFKPGEIVRLNKRKYYLLLHPMTCIYDSHKGEERYINTINKIQQYRKKNVKVQYQTVLE